jgi:hypothetical protein
VTFGDKRPGFLGAIRPGPPGLDQRSDAQGTSRSWPVQRGCACIHRGAAPQVCAKPDERLLQARAYRTIGKLSRNRSFREHEERRAQAFPGHGERKVLEAAAAAYEDETAAEKRTRLSPAPTQRTTS